jgi:hypothetical protein
VARRTPAVLCHDCAHAPRCPPHRRACCHPYFQEESSLSPEDATSRVKGLAKHLGADLVGITEIDPLWVYSRRGEIFWDNWDEWGGEIELHHRYAIVFAMAMSRDMVWAAPHTASVVESGAVSMPEVHSSLPSWPPSSPSSRIPPRQITFSTTTYCLFHSQSMQVWESLAVMDT